MKFLITVTLLIWIEKTIRRLNRLRADAVTLWPAIRRAWFLLAFQIAILGAWVMLAVFDLKPTIDPMRIAADVWNQVRGR